MIKKIVFFILIITFVSCTKKNVKEYANVDELVKEAKTEVEFVSVDEIKTILDSKAPIYLIDCREVEEFDSACIQSAINIPRGILEGSISEKAPRHNNTVYIYCSNGDRSTLVAKVLPALKYSDVKVLEGGFEALKAKYPALIELHPVRAGTEKKAAAKPSGGCGG